MSTRAHVNVLPPRTEHGAPTITSGAAALADECARPMLINGLAVAVTSR